MAPLQRILTVNVGSTGVKLRVVGADDEVEATVDLEPAQPGAWPDALAACGPVDGIGHRVVHGGTRFTQPVRLDADVLREIAALTELAPLHQRPALDAVQHVQASLPGVPAVACFDTAFHATLPAAAYTYALPERWRELGMRKYGFHGLSHAVVLAARAELAPLGRAARIVTCHLGGGASLAAVHGGRCVDTTMGFTPLDGLVMASRSGAVDPGLIVWLIGQRGYSAREVGEVLEHESGLVGLAGTPDMRDVVARAAGEDRIATLALDVYVHRLAGSVAAMAASMGGVDAIAFTGGVGEHAPSVRMELARRLGFLGVAVDEHANRATEGDGDVSAPGAGVKVLVVRAREDLELAAGVRAALG